MSIDVIAVLIARIFLIVLSAFPLLALFDHPEPQEKSSAL